MKRSVLLLDDDEKLALALRREFEDNDYEAIVATSIGVIPSRVYDFAVVDMRLRGEFGFDAIDRIKEFSPECRIVVLTGYGSISTAVEAVKRGAIDYLTKPAGFQAIEAALLGQRTSPEPEFKPPSLSQVEHDYIDFVLTKNEGNISKTAKDLGLHRQSLQRKLKKYT